MSGVLGGALEDVFVVYGFWIVWVVGGAVVVVDGVYGFLTA